MPVVGTRANLKIRTSGISRLFSKSSIESGELTVQAPSRFRQLSVVTINTSIPWSVGQCGADDPDARLL